MRRRNRLTLAALSAGTAVLLAGSAAFGPIALADSTSVTVDPGTSVDFGSVTIGTSSTKTLTVKNNGPDPATIHSIYTTGSPFSQSNNCPLEPATLDAGMSCQVFATFTPASQASYSGVLVIDDDPIFINLTGTGAAAPASSGNTGGNTGGNNTTGGSSNSGSSSSSGNATGGTSTGGNGGTGTGGTGATCGAPSGGGLINIGPLVCFGWGGNGTGGNGGNAGNAGGGNSSSNSNSQSGNGGNAGNGTGSANGNGNGSGGSGSSGSNNSGGKKDRKKKACEKDGIPNNCKKKSSKKKH